MSRRVAQSSHGFIFLSGHHGRHSGDAGTGGGNSEENSSFVSGGVGEKRTRFAEFFLAFPVNRGPVFVFPLSFVSRVA